MDKYKDDADLLSIFLSDEVFKDNINFMIDECVIFFLGGSFTLTSSNSNLI
jgi:hypothetical protein